MWILGQERLEHPFGLSFRWWLVQTPPSLTWQRSSPVSSLSNKHLRMVSRREKSRERSRTVFKNFGTSLHGVSKKKKKKKLLSLNEECDLIKFDYIKGRRPNSLPLSVSLCVYQRSPTITLITRRSWWEVPCLTWSPPTTAASTQRRSWLLIPWVSTTTRPPYLFCTAISALLPLRAGGNLAIYSTF